MSAPAARSHVTTHRRKVYNTTGHTYAASRYGTDHMSAYLARRNAALLDIAARVATRQGRTLDILEIGCGPGLSLAHLAQTPHALHGMDVSDVMVHQAQQRLGPRATITVGDAAHLTHADGSFDVVYATRFIHQFDHDTKRLLWHEAMRVTRHGGVVVMEFYARPYHWLRYFTPARKGRDRAEYFKHYPTRAEVGQIASQHEIIPLRWAGERIGAPRILLDEYFVVAHR